MPFHKIRRELEVEPRRHKRKNLLPVKPSRFLLGRLPGVENSVPNGESLYLKPKSLRSVRKYADKLHRNSGKRLEVKYRIGKLVGVHVGDWNSYLRDGSVSRHGDCVRVSREYRSRGLLVVHVEHASPRRVLLKLADWIRLTVLTCQQTKHKRSLEAACERHPVLVSSAIAVGNIRKCRVSICVKHDVLHLCLLSESESSGYAEVEVLVEQVYLTVLVAQCSCVLWIWRKHRGRERIDNIHVRNW